MRLGPGLALVVSAAAAAGAGELRGRLLVGDPPAPAAGVTVQALPFESPLALARREARGEPAPAPLADASSGADGSFSLRVSVSPRGDDAPAAGDGVRLRFEREGLLPVALERILFAAEDADVGPVLLVRGKPLSGRLVDPAGGPVVGALVSLRAGRAWPGSDSPTRPLLQTRLSDSQGGFRFEQAGEGRNQLRVEALALAVSEPESLSPGELAAPLRLTPGAAVAGRLWQADGVTPARGALVRVEGGRAPSRWHEAGPDGRFRIEDVAPGAAMIVARASDGWGRASVTDSPGAPVELRLSAAARIEGRATSQADERPIADATVSARSGDETWAVRTDADGRWSIPGPAPGVWQLGVEAAGHVPWRRVPVRLAAGETVSADAVLLPAAALRGRVVDESGQPVADASLRVEPSGQVGIDAFRARLGGVPGGIRSGADGRFEARALAPGPGQSLTVEHPDYARQQLGGIDLVPGQIAPPLTVVLSRGLTIDGAVRDRDGVPLPGVELSLMQQRTFSSRAGGVRMMSSRTRSARHSDAEGRFRFAGLLPGSYSLSAALAGYARSGLSLFELPPGGLPEPLELVLGPGAAIRGVVRTPAGMPAEGHTVMALPSEAGAGRPQPIWGDATGADGLFELTQLEAGAAYDLQVTSEEDLPGTLRGVVAPAEGVVLEAPGEGGIRGRALDETGAPLVEFEVGYSMATRPGASFRSSRPGYGANRVAVRSEAGEFVLERVAAGTWDVEVRSEGYQPGRASRVVVEEGRVTAGVEVRLARGHTLAGRVVAARGGRPVVDAQVDADAVQDNRRRIFFGGGDPDSKAQRTDADGRFEIAGLAPGSYTVSARHGDWSDVSTTVELRGERTEAELRMEEGGRVRGSVLSGSAPVANAHVSLTVVGDPMAAFLDTWSGLTDAEGRFQFEHVAAGRYSAFAELQNRSSQSVEVSVAGSGAIADVVLTFDGGARIVGTIEGLAPEELLLVRVSASGPGGYSAQALVSADGRFELTGAPPGTTQLRARTGDWDRSRNTGTAVPIAEGQLEVSAVLRFETGFRLEGRITRAGEPLADSYVNAQLEGGAHWASSRSDADGQYRIEGLVAGRYQLRISTPGAVGAGARRTLDVNGDTSLDVEIPTARVAGRVVDAADGRPLGDVSVTLQDVEDRWRGWSQTDSQGRFAIEDLDPGRYRGHFSKPAYQQLVRELAAAESGEPTIALQAGEGIPILVRDGIFGTPLPAVQVRVEDGGGALVYAGGVGLDSGGRGQLPALPDGSYRLRVAASGYAPSLEIGLSSPASELALALTPGGAVEIQVGAVTRARSVPACRLLRPDGRAYAPYLASADPAIRLVAASVRLEHITPGRYLLVVDGGDSQEVEIREGGVAGVRLP